MMGKLPPEELTRLESGRSRDIKLQITLEGCFPHAFTCLAVRLGAATALVELRWLRGCVVRGSEDGDFAMLREKEVEEQTVFVISGRSDAQSTLTSLRSVQSLKLYGRAASELFAEYTMRYTCKKVATWNQCELATATERESTVECNESRARHSLRGER
jgi:hypothetical protein